MQHSEYMTLMLIQFQRKFDFLSLQKEKERSLASFSNSPTALIEAELLDKRIILFLPWLTNDDDLDSFSMRRTSLEKVRYQTFEGI